MTLYDVLRTTRYDQRFCCYLTNVFDQNVPIGFGVRKELLDADINDDLYDYLMCDVDMITVAKDGALVVRVLDEHFTRAWKNSTNAREDGRYRTQQPDRSNSAQKWRTGITVANRGDVISVDRLWDVFDVEREKAWDGVDAPVGSPEWNIAAGKIDVINNICNAVHNMNGQNRDRAQTRQKSPFGRKHPALYILTMRMVLRKRRP